ALGDHHRNGVLHAQKGAVDFDIVDGLPVLVGVVRQLGRPLVDTGVVEQAVDAAIGGHRAVHHGLDTGLIGDVAGETCGPATGGGDFLRQRLHQLAAAGGEHHAGTGPGKTVGGHPADTLAGTGDDNDFVHKQVVGDKGLLLS